MEFRIQEICADRVDQQGEVNYFIKWVDFSEDENTWEVSHGHNNHN
jgi:hypothetical protein